LSERERIADFERVVTPHTKAAFELARWLVRDEHDAEDIVQEAYLRAFKYFDGFNGTNARTWLLAIVRNAFYTWRERESVRESEIPLAPSGAIGATEDGVSELDLVASPHESPDARSERTCDREIVDRAIRALPVEFREVIVLRELEDLSYKEIAAVIEIPIGTVMSRIARGREQLRKLLAQDVSEELSR
jgi:RNA polymerase sigma-70 factor (ECF subfamily)